MVGIMLDFFFAISPLLVIFIVIVWLGKPANIGGVIAWLSTLAVSCLYFQTDLKVALSSALSGAISSFPVSLVIVVAMLQVTIMAETGAIKRISVLFKAFAVDDAPTQVLFLSCAVSTVLTTMGAVPITLLPPIMFALGYPVSKAIALPVMGYAATCIYALMGVTLDILSAYMGVDSTVGGLYVSQYMFAANFAVALGCLWVAGGRAMLKKGLIPAFLTGMVCHAGAVLAAKTGLVSVSGLIIGFMMIFAFMLYLKIKGKKIYDVSCLTDDDKAVIKAMPLWRATSPWICLILFAIVINSPFLPFHAFLTQPFYIHIIPGLPEKTRVLSQAYFWLIIFTIICTPIMRPQKGAVKTAVKKWISRAYRPGIAAISFFSLAYLFNHSGRGADWEFISLGHNMMHIAAGSAANIVGNMYCALAPFIGLLAGMLTGSQAAIVAMLSGLHMQAAELVGGTGFIIASAGATGAGIASMVSPMKILNAASTLDSPQSGAKVIRKMLGLSFIVTLVVALNAIVLEFF